MIVLFLLLFGLGRWSDFALAFGAWVVGGGMKAHGVWHYGNGGEGGQEGGHIRKWHNWHNKYQINIPNLMYQNYPYFS